MFTSFIQGELKILHENRLKERGFFFLLPKCLTIIILLFIQLGQGYHARSIYSKTTYHNYELEDETAHPVISLTIHLITCKGRLTQDILPSFVSI